MRVLLFALWFLALPAIAAQQEAGSPWSPIHWETTSPDRPVQRRLTLNIPIRLDGLACMAQLDTGANFAFLPSAPLSEEGPRVSVELRVSAAVLRVDVPEKTLQALHARPDCGRAGVVGNAAFESGTLQLDLQRNRFRFDPSARLRDQPSSSPFRYMRLPGGEGGHLALPITYGESQKGLALLDTGAAAFAFVFFDEAATADAWAVLRARGSAVEALSIAPSREIAKCEIREAAMPLGFGKFQAVSGLVARCPRPAFAGDGLVGVIGMQAFQHGVLTLDYLSSRWTFSEE